MINFKTVCFNLFKNCDKEETTIYSAMPAGNHKRACNLIAELACESIFPTKKLDLEREVICDEIDSYLDSPSEAIYDSPYKPNGIVMDPTHDFTKQKIAQRVSKAR